MAEVPKNITEIIGSHNLPSKQYTNEYVSMVSQRLRPHHKRINRFKSYKPKQEGVIPSLLLPNDSLYPYVVTPHGNELNIVEPVKQCTKLALISLPIDWLAFFRVSRIIESSPDLIEKFMALDAWDSVAFEYNRAVISPQDYITLAGLGLLQEPFLIRYSELYKS